MTKPTVLFVCVHNAARSQVNEVRTIRDEIDERVQALAGELLH